MQTADQTQEAHPGSTSEGRLSAGALRNLADRVLGARLMAQRAAGAFRQSVARYRPYAARSRTAVGNDRPGHQPHLAGPLPHASGERPVSNSLRATNRPHARLARANPSGFALKSRQSASAIASGVFGRTGPSTMVPEASLQRIVIRLYGSFARAGAAVRQATPSENREGTRRSSRTEVTERGSITPSRVPVWPSVRTLRFSTGRDHTGECWIQSFAPISVPVPMRELRPDTRAFRDQGQRPADEMSGGSVEGSGRADPYLDRYELGRWMTDYLERQMLRPKLGMTDVDPRVTPF